MLFLTGLIIVLTPFRLHEFLTCRRKIDAVRLAKAPVFVCGYYRSGTTFLHYLLSQDKQFTYCSTLHCVNPWIFLKFRGLCQWLMKKILPNKRPMDNLKMSADAPFEEEFALANMCGASLCHGYFFPRRLKEYFDRFVLFKDENSQDIDEWKRNLILFIKKLTLLYPGKRLLLKTPANTARVREILELFPNATFIHIHRDPYRVFLSNERLYEKILPLLSFHRVSKEEVKEFILYSYQESYRKFYCDIGSLSSKRIVHVGYDDLVSDPMATLERIYEQIELKGFAKNASAFMEILDQYKGYKINSLRMNAKLKLDIQTCWQDIFERLGYS